jgi:NAD(P)-dependent dehydrogenase (short-subunit alcohol dehydrogenase family)
MSRSVLIVGGTSGLGRAAAERLAGQGDEVTITGSDPQRAAVIAAEIGPGVKRLGFDMCDPGAVAPGLTDAGPVDHLILSAIARDTNSVRDYDIDAAVRALTLKLISYTTVVGALGDRLARDGSIIMFGGLAKDRPYPGSTSVSTANGGISGLARTLAHELAPIRVNVIHPGIVGDSPAWRDRPAAVLDGFVRLTPIGRLVTMDEVTDGVCMLMDNNGINGIELVIDGGSLLNWSAPTPA